MFEVESIVGVFDFKINRWYLVIWAGHDESEWERDNETTCLKKPKLLDILKIKSVSTNNTSSKYTNITSNNRHNSQHYRYRMGNSSSKTPCNTY